MARFYSIFDLCETEDDVYDVIQTDLSLQLAKCQPAWTEGEVRDFCEKWEHDISMVGDYRIHQIVKH